MALQFDLGAILSVHITTTYMLVVTTCLQWFNPVKGLQEGGQTDVVFIPGCYTCYSIV